MSIQNEQVVLNQGACPVYFVTNRNKFVFEIGVSTFRSCGWMGLVDLSYVQDRIGKTETSDSHLSPICSFDSIDGVVSPWDWQEIMKGMPFIELLSKTKQNHSAEELTSIDFRYKGNKMQMYNFYYECEGGLGLCFEMKTLEEDGFAHDCARDIVAFIKSNDVYELQKQFLAKYAEKNKVLQLLFRVLTLNECGPLLSRELLLRSEFATDSTAVLEAPSRQRG